MLDSISVEVSEATSTSKCDLCTNSQCCTYVTQKVLGPRSMYDFDHLLWQVSHENIELYKDSDGWCLLIANRCSHLSSDGGCGIYNDRPQICRDHSNDYCEYDAPATEGFDLYFKTFDSLSRYCKKRFKHWGSHREG